MSWTPVTSGGELHHPMAPRVLRQRKKKELTPEEKVQRMKGISKAFVKADAGWSKVQPVHKDDTADSSSSSDDDEGYEDELQNEHNNNEPSTTTTTTTPPLDTSTDKQESSEGEEEEEEDVMALLRAQTRIMQRERQQQQQQQQQQTAEDSSTTTLDKKVQDTTTSQSAETGKTSQLKLLQRLSTMAQTKGHEAAWAWLQDQIDRGGPGLLVLSKEQSLTQQSPKSNTTTTTTSTTDPSNTDRRSLPHPKRHFTSTQHAVQMEQQYVSYFRQAAHVVPYEYYYYEGSSSSSLSEKNISITIRRPYGKEPRATWTELSDRTPEEYGRRAHISEATALEVAVLLKRDATRIPLVFVSASKLIKYRTHPGGAMQISKKLVKGNPSPSSLGLYYGYQTDTQGSYQTYNLDDLLQQAIWVREQYCSAVTSTALGLRQQSAQTAVATTATETTSDVPTTTTVQTHSVSVDTSDLVVEDDSEILKENTAVPPQITTPSDYMYADSTKIKVRSLIEETARNSEKPRSILDYSLNDVIRWASNHRLLSRVAGNRNVLRVVMLLALLAMMYMFGIQHYIRSENSRELGVEATA
jgi:hypothetical protein